MGPMPTQQKIKRNFQCLKKTQLCLTFEECKYFRQGRCSFAHSLEELAPPPTSWSTTRSHYWQRGWPKPNESAMNLIHVYAMKTSRPVPDWAKELLGWKRARVGDVPEPSAASSSAVPPKPPSPPTSPEPGEEVPDWAGDPDEEAEPEQQEGGPNEKADRDDPEDMPQKGWVAMQARVKAMLGWQDAGTWPKRDPVGTASLNLREVPVRLTLCGFQEFTNLWQEDSSNMIAVQCVRGKWLDTMVFPNRRRLLNLSKWSVWQKQGVLCLMQ